MPRRKTAVKPKLRAVRTPGLIDLHFHGAFGIDLMRASGPEMALLSHRLLGRGLAAYCPTTLSVSARELEDSVRRIGAWIRESDHSQGALPLGIHLEGPFISPAACGAHPPGILRKPTLKELDRLWRESRETLKILTVAPEIVSPAELKAVVRWCGERAIVLSLGHSRATEAQAAQAFAQGFTNVTHAWNAMGFHQRVPGVLGAAIGNPRVFLELIADQVHVSPTVIRWTRALHPADRVCFVSDCAPAAALRASQTATFGPLKVRNLDGACRLPDGSLAGGGLLLPDAFARWVSAEAKTQAIPASRLLALAIVHVTRAPLESLKLPPSQIRRILARTSLLWRAGSSDIRIDSLALRG